jgi:isoleucyl-tRNA synthetase
VHLAQFPLDAESYGDAASEERWTRLIAIRDQVNAALEQARQQKLIGTALAAAVTLSGNAGTMAVLRAHERELPMLFITSAVSLGEVTEDAGVSVQVARAPGEKCPRCWRYVQTLEGEICTRCAGALGTAVETHG